MASFNLILHRAYIKAKDGKKDFSPEPSRIYLVFIIDRSHMIKIKSDEKILPRYWDFDKQKVKAQAPGSVEINQRLEKMVQDAKDHYRDMMNSEPQPTYQQVIDSLKNVVSTGQVPILEKKTNRSFFDVYEDYKVSKGMEIKPLTLKKYNTLKVNLQEFEKSFGKITFEDIDLRFYDKFKTYLLEKENYISGKKGLRNDTVSKYLENLKSFLKWSHERGYHQNIIYSHSNFKSDRKQKHEIVTLTADEVRKIQTVDLSDNPRMEKVRDVFLFAVFTGQRWGDVHGFRPKDVDTRVWIFEAQKTGKITRVPFIGYSAPAFEILQKYEGNLPKMTDVEFNRVLKKVGVKAEITEEVEIKRYIGKKEIIIRKPKHEFMSSHMARRTAVTMLLERGVPPTTVMKLTGHESLKTVLKYENTSDDALIKALENVGNITFQGLKIAN